MVLIYRCAMAGHPYPFVPSQARVTSSRRPRERAGGWSSSPTTGRKQNTARVTDALQGGKIAEAQVYDLLMVADAIPREPVSIISNS